jgi:hypothetical protein
MNRFTQGLLLVLGLLVAGVALADKPFVRVPGSTAPISLKVDGYHGGTNGELTVEVRNDGKATTDFDAQGLYFVPTGDPDKAPQRLGAVGPFQQKGQSGWERKRTLTLQPGATATIKLDVYCIDSHRRSPTTGDNFKMAKDRMPKTLSTDIYKAADSAAATVGGYAAPAAKSSVQSEVWKNRDKKWIKLDGEGRQEATK